MKITVCGYTKASKQTLKSLISFLRREVPNVLGEIKEIKIIRFKGHPFDWQGWMKEFDIYNKGVVTLRLPSAYDAKLAKGWAIHELYHAKQQAEKRLVKITKDSWRHLYFRKENQDSGQNYLFIGAFWNVKQSAFTFQFCGDDLKYYMGFKQVPWEWENVQWMKKNYTDLYNKMYGNT